MNENQIDLAWHEREFALKRSFSWIVRNLQGKYIGCAYLFPNQGRRVLAKVVTWIRSSCPDRAGILEKLNTELNAWLAEVLAGMDICLLW